MGRVLLSRAEGILLSLDRANKRGRVDTRNDAFGVLTVYFREIPDIQLNSTVIFDVIESENNNKYAKFISAAERNRALFNTEDRAQWYKLGEKTEVAFVEKIVPSLGIDLRINPEKVKNPWTIDLFDYTNNRYADLKTQTTPFFTAGKYSYGGAPYDPTYTVTFNKKDYEKYKKEHPDCDIYFWIYWIQRAYKNIRVDELYGVWKAPFRKMAEKIEAQEVALHGYQHRQNDDHNAKESYLFNLNDRNVFERLI